MTPLIPVLEGGLPVTFAIHPPLPVGINFGETNATIWGYPTELSSRTEYTIYANNSGGSGSTILYLTVEDKEPGFYYPEIELVMYANNDPIELPMEALSYGGEVENWSITPLLPEGLVFEF